MINLHYRLTPENFKQLNCYLALRDRKLQKRLFTIICSLSVFIIVLSFILFRFSIYTILMSATVIILTVLLMPRVYWNMVFKRADRFVDNTNIVYSDIEAEISESIRVRENRRLTEIYFSDIVNFGYTRDNCILLYQDGEKINTLILPVNSFSEKQLKEFHLQLEEKVHGKTGNA